MGHGLTCMYVSLYYRIRMQFYNTFCIGIKYNDHIKYLVIIKEIKSKIIIVLGILVTTPPQIVFQYQIK